MPWSSQALRARHHRGVVERTVRPAASAGERRPSEDQRLMLPVGAIAMDLQMIAEVRRNRTTRSPARLLGARRYAPPGRRSARRAVGRPPGPPPVQRSAISSPRRSPAYIAVAHSARSIRERREHHGRLAGASPVPAGRGRPEREANAWIPVHDLGRHRVTEDRAQGQQHVAHRGRFAPLARESLYEPVQLAARDFG